MGCELTALYATAPTHAPAVAATERARRIRGAFRRFRKTRPFWAGFWTIAAGSLITYVPLTAFKFTFVAQGLLWAGVLIGLLIITLGISLWVQPQLRTIVSVAIVLLSLFSFITSDFGGLFVGMLLGIVGGSLAFGWTSTLPQPQQEHEPASAEVLATVHALAGGQRDERRAA